MSFSKTLLLEQFLVDSKTERKVQRSFPDEPCSHRCTASPVTNSPHQMVHLLQLMNLH